MFYSVALIICGILVMIFLEDNKPVKEEKKPEPTLNMKDFLRVAKMPPIWLCGLLADKLGSRIRFMQYAYEGMAVFASLYVLIPTGPKVVPLICGLRTLPVQH